MAGVARIPNDIFQFSLHSAYTQGLTSTGPPASALSGYGTHGIGYVASPRPGRGGDLLLLDAVPYLLTDGATAVKVSERGENTALAFVMVTKFQPESRAVVPRNQNLSLAGLPAVFASQGADAGGRNSLMPFCVRSASFTSMTVVAADGEHVLRDVEGTLFGFDVPEWAQGSICGPAGETVRCCFLESGPSGGGRTRGGFVRHFEVRGEAVVEWAVCGRFHLGLPSGEEWQGLRL